MNRLLLWITTAILGSAATLMTSFGLLAALLFLLLAGPLILLGDRVVALSGLLTGFGAFWTFLMARQFASGGTTDNADFWMAVGVVPLVLGSALIALIAAGQGARGRPPSADQAGSTRSRADRWRPQRTLKTGVPVDGPVPLPRWTTGRAARRAAAE